MTDRAINVTKERYDDIPVPFIPNKFYITKYNLILYVTDKPCPYKKNGVMGYWATQWNGIEEHPTSKDDLVAYADKNDIFSFFHLYNDCYVRKIKALKREIKQYSMPLKEWNNKIWTIFGDEDDRHG